MLTRYITKRHQTGLLKRQPRHVYTVYTDASKISWVAGITETKKKQLQNRSDRNNLNQQHFFEEGLLERKNITPLMKKKDMAYLTLLEDLTTFPGSNTDARAYLS